MTPRPPRRRTNPNTKRKGSMPAPVAGVVIPATLPVVAAEEVVDAEVVRAETDPVTVVLGLVVELEELVLSVDGVELDEVVDSVEVVLELLELVDLLELVLELLEVVDLLEMVLELLEVVDLLELVLELLEVVDLLEVVLELLEVVDLLEVVLELVEVVDGEELVLELLEVVDGEELVLELLDVDDVTSAGHVWVRLKTCASPPVGVPVPLSAWADASSRTAPAGAEA